MSERERALDAADTDVWTEPPRKEPPPLPGMERAHDERARVNANEKPEPAAEDEEEAEAIKPRKAPHSTA